MNSEELHSRHAGINAEFLSQFSLNCVGVGFTGFALSTWELPEPAVPLMTRSLADQVAAVALDDGREHTDQCVGFSGQDADQSPEAPIVRRST